MNGLQPKTNLLSDEMLRDLSTPILAKPVLEDISVVIPTLGRPILESCLRWLAEGSHWPNHVIVVDQGCKRAVVGWLTQLQEAGLNCLYLPSEQEGKAAGINRGMELVQTQYVAITDDDCFVSFDWLKRMAEHLRRNPGIIISGRVELAGTETGFSVVTSQQPMLYTKPQLKGQPFSGGNAGLAIELAHKIGPFDEHPCLISAAEDSDYGYRALRLRIPIAYEPDVVLYHYHWRDASERAARYADYAQGHGAFLGTHLRRGDKLVLAQTVIALVRSPVRWLRGILTGDQDLIDNGRAHTLNLPRGIIAGLKRTDL